jgi:hypothetical protein
MQRVLSPVAHWWQLDDNAAIVLVLHHTIMVLKPRKNG